MKNLGLQLFTIRDYMGSAEEIDASFAKLSALGYTEGQTAGFPKVDNETFAMLAKKNGIKIIGTHYAYDNIVNQIEDTMNVHRLWDTTNVGIGGMPEWARYSLDGLEKFINDYNAAAKVYAKEGFRLTYHNHSFEFVRIDGNKTIMDYLYEKLDPENISFVLDTCWVAHGGADVRLWMEKLAGRVDILHLKDLKVYNDENKKIQHVMTEIGNGNLWWDGIMETAKKIGVKHYTVEQDKAWVNDSPFDALKVSADYLKKYMA